jgi:beta-phosphoglucomutase family hydrolase
MAEKLYLVEHDAALPERIKGLIFDCDGTLVDTMPVHFIAWTAALEKHGLELDEKRFYEFAGMPTQKIIEILSAEQGIEVSAEEIAHEKEQMYLEAIPGVKRIGKVVDIAEREKGRRKLAVASGGWKRVVLHSLRSAKLDGLFPVIVGADDVVHGKPAPDVFLEAARRMGLRPEECMVYEDGELGFEAAKAAGMECVDVRPWYGAGGSP